MSDAARWPRPHWQARPGEDALLLYFVFGDFPRKLNVPLGKYASRGLPDGVQLYRHPHAQLRQWEGYPLGGALGEILREDSPQAVARAETAGEVLSVRGSVADPASLDYLRDTIGVVAGLLDLGGTSVVDPQMLSLFPAATWRGKYLVRNGAPPRSHVLILVNADEGGGQWVHTRGMRKFARPDISLRQVPESQAERAGALCHKLAEMQALGAWIEDGQEIEIDGIPAPLTARHGGDLSDPRFNNSHIELRWPSEKHRPQADSE